MNASEPFQQKSCKQKKCIAPKKIISRYSQTTPKTPSESEMFKIMLSALRHLGPSGGTMAQVRYHILCHEDVQMKLDKLTMAVKQALHHAILMGCIRRRICDGKYYIVAESTGHCKRKCTACREHKQVSGLHATSMPASAVAKKSEARWQVTAAKPKVFKCQNVHGRPSHWPKGIDSRIKNASKLPTPRTIPSPPAQALNPYGDPYGRYVNEDIEFLEDEESVRCFGDDVMEVEDEEEEEEETKKNERKVSKCCDPRQSHKSMNCETHNRSTEKASNSEEGSHNRKEREVVKSGKGHNNGENKKLESKPSERTTSEKKKTDHGCILM